MVVELVGLLVVDKDVGRADTLEPGLQDRLVSHIRKQLLNKGRVRLAVMNELQNLYLAIKTAPVTSAEGNARQASVAAGERGVGKEKSHAVDLKVYLRMPRITIR